MFCSNCGKEIESDVKFCKYCGYALAKEAKTGQESDSEFEPSADRSALPEVAIIPQVTQYSTKNPIKTLIERLQVDKKFRIITVGVVAVIFLIVCAVLSSGTLNADEKLAYNNCVYLKNTLKDPNSFTLYDEMFLLKHYDDDGTQDYTYTIFKYGGSNSYGAIVTNEAIFKDDKYIMDYADEPDSDDSNYSAEVKAKADIARWILTDSSENTTWERVDIDVDKIVSKMGLDG